MKDIRCLFKHKYVKEKVRLISGNECYGCTRCGIYIIKNSVGSYEISPEKLMVEIERGYRFHNIIARQQSAQEEFEFLTMLRFNNDPSYDPRQMAHLRSRVRSLQGLMNDLTREILTEASEEGTIWL